MQATILAWLLAFSMVLAGLLAGGESARLVVALVGLALLGPGLWWGQGPLTAVGTALTALGGAIATRPDTLGLVVLSVIGVVASLVLVTADASWWLRRQPAVQLAVGQAAARALIPGWVLGAALGIGVALLAGRYDRATVWLLPAALAVTGALVALVAWALRHRHLRRDPSSDLRS